MTNQVILFLRMVARRLLPKPLRVVLWTLQRATKKLLRVPPLAALRALDILASTSPSTIAPWFRDRHERLQLALRPRLVPKRRLQRSFREALTMLHQRRGLAHFGDYLEFGVYNGTSLVCMYRALQELGLDTVRMFGFDSFQGLPQAAVNHDEGGLWQAGQFAVSYEFVEMVLRHEGVDPERVHVVPGWFEQTLTAETVGTLGIQKVSVVMIDCDLYASTKEALRFTAPLISDSAIFVFDDWHVGELARRRLGERRAFEEFLIDHPEFSSTPLRKLRYTRHAEVFLVERRAG